MKQHSIPVLALLLTPLFFGTSKAQTNKISLNPKYDSKFDSIMRLMTLEEKMGQMNKKNGFWEVTGQVPIEGDAVIKYEQLRKVLVRSMLNVNGVENVRAVQKISVEDTRMGIPLIIGYDIVHGYKTISPLPLAEAASWDFGSYTQVYGSGFSRGIRSRNQLDLCSGGGYFEGFPLGPGDGRCRRGTLLG